MSIDLKSKLLSEFSNFELQLNGSKSSLLHNIRKNAIDKFSTIGFPTLKHEDWKYTSLNFLNKHDFFMQFTPDDSKINDKDIEKYVIRDFNQNLIVFINGFYSKRLSRLQPRGEKIWIGSLAKALKKRERLIEYYFNKITSYENDAFTAINTAYSNDGACIFIPDGMEDVEPIHLLFINDTREKPLLVQPRNLIVAGCCANLKIVQTINTLGGNPAFSNTVTEIFQKPYSQVDFYEYQSNNSNSYLIENNNIVQEKGSVFNSATITLNGAFIRNNLNALLSEEAVESNFYGFYYLDETNFVDNHTSIDHAKPNCSSNEIYKGVLDGRAKAVFNGKILVRKDAQKTNAYQTNKNIVLTDDASINTKPQLEIFADDVKCSHGATSGYFDKDALFYLKSRGISEIKAKALLLNAFAGEIVEKINISELRDAIKTKISDRLNVEDIYFCDNI